MNTAMLRAMNFIVGMEEIFKMLKLKFITGLGVVQFIHHMVRGLLKDFLTTKKENRKNMNKELTIKVPEGCVIDKEHTDLDAGIIVYKKQGPAPWNYEGQNMQGYHIRGDEIRSQERYVACSGNFDVYASEALAKAALAAAQISQYMANDQRYGGVVTDEEWGTSKVMKYCIRRWNNRIDFMSTGARYCFLAFHSEEQASLFYEDHKDLVKDFLMIS
jgi:hypothetical protein